MPRVSTWTANGNSVENAIRAVAVGRTHWLFPEDPQGGGLRAEVLYTLLVTCHRLGVDPFECLRDVIDRVSFFGSMQPPKEYQLARTVLISGLRRVGMPSCLPMAGSGKPRSPQQDDRLSHGARRDAKDHDRKGHRAKGRGADQGLALRFTSSLPHGREALPPG